MFEREVKFIYDFNASKVKKLGSQATYAELLPLNLHLAIMKYISAEIEYRVYEDRQTLLKHSMFDYSGSEISKHFKNIANEIKREKKFSTDFLCKVILHATSFNVNYLIRPNWSLKKLIFDTSDSNNVEEIKQILNYVYFYKHIPKVLSEYFDKKKLITLNKDEFGALLEKIDGASFDQYGKDLLESAIKSMASFFNIGSMNQTKVPLQAIGVYLTEKNLKAHLAKLEAELRGETKSKIEIKDLRNILFDVPLEQSESMITDEPAGEDVQLEDEETIGVEPETEPAVEAEPIVSEEEEEIQLETAEENLPEEEIESQFDDDIEIKLRANKEKEVLADEPEDEIEFEEKEESYNDTDESAEHLVKESEKTSEVILAPDDEDESNDQETEAELFTGEEETGDVEELELPDDDTTELEILDDAIYTPEEETEDFEEEKPSLVADEETEELEEDVHEEEKSLDFEYHLDQTDDYSHPNLGLEEKGTQKNDEIEEEDEVVSEEDFEKELDEQLVEETDEEDEVKIEEPEDDDIDVDQSTLFGDLPDDLFEDETGTAEREDFIKDFGESKHAKKIEIADLLENKNMTKIIAVVFDYDMEEFANAIEKICESSTSGEAFTILDEIFEFNDVNPSSKEAQNFREIIAEYFEQT